MQLEICSGLLEGDLGARRAFLSSGLESIMLRACSAAADRLKLG